MKRFIYTLIFISLSHIDSYATHLRAGYITVEQLSSSSLACHITVLVYTNSESVVMFGGSSDNGKDFILDLGDGTKVEVPGTSSTPRPDLGSNIGVATFQVIHTYLGFGSYLVSYAEPSRNGGVLNIHQSSTSNFYVETRIVLDVGQTYTSPKSLLQPIFFGQSGQPYSESMAQVDVHDNQLIYQMITPQSDRNTNVSNYRLPENFSIDPISGLISWDAKFNGLPTIGEFAFAVKTYQIRNNKVIGYMIRDFQIIVEDIEDSGEIINGGDHENGRVYIPENSSIILRVDVGSKSNAIDLKITSELEGSPANFSYTIEDSIHEDMFYKVAKILYTNSSDIARTNPYIITARATFDGVYGKARKDLVYVVATKDIHYEVPLILNADDERIPKITIHPNPVQNVLHISNNDNRNVAVKIFDLNGKVHIQQAMRGTSIIDVSNLPSGMYVCKLLVNGKMVSYKIIKE